MGRLGLESRGLARAAAHFEQNEALEVSQLVDSGENEAVSTWFSTL